MTAGWRGGNFSLDTATRPALEPTQPPIHLVPGALSPGVKLTTDLHLVPKLRLRGAVRPLPHTSSMHGH